MIPQCVKDLSKRSAMSILVTVLAFGDSTTVKTTVRGIVYTKTGDAFTGTVAIELQQNTIEASHRSLTYVPVEDGMLSVRLMHNTQQITYKVTYVPGDATASWSEIWHVNPVDHLLLEEVRSTEPTRPDSSQTSPDRKDITLPIAMSDVSGLNTALAQINTSLAQLTTAVNAVSTTAHMLAASTRIVGEVPSGAIDGQNKTFVLSSAPVPQASLSLSVNGVRQRQGVDYTIAAATISFSGGAIPRSGDVIVADYSAINGTRGRRQESATKAVTLPIPINGVAGLSTALSNINATLSSLTSTANSVTTTVQTLSSVTAIYAETPSGAANGANRIFTLSAVPQQGKLALFRNGIRQEVGIDYSLNGATITFTSAATPQSGDVLIADYLTSAQ